MQSQAKTAVPSILLFQGLPLEGLRSMPENIYPTKFSGDFALLYPKSSIFVR